MHTKPVPESSGSLTPIKEEVSYCSTCQKPTTTKCEQWDSHDGAYTDYKYTCTVCGTIHWIDGDDG